MTESPVIFDDGSELLILLLRMYFFLSNFWRCLSAMAVTEEIAVSKNSKVEAFALCAMVMSAPMVELWAGGVDVVRYCWVQVERYIEGLCRDISRICVLFLYLQLSA